MWNHSDLAYNLQPRKPQSTAWTRPARSRNTKDVIRLGDLHRERQVGRLVAFALVCLVVGVFA